MLRAQLQYRMLRSQTGSTEEMFKVPDAHGRVTQLNAGPVPCAGTHRRELPAQDRINRKTNLKTDTDCFKATTIIIGRWKCREQPPAM